MDYAATTYTKPEVLSEMMPYFGKDFGNPSSVHEYGRVAKNQEEARGKIAAAINAARENEIYFTSGGTEADNMAIMGAASASKKESI